MTKSKGLQKKSGGAAEQTDTASALRRLADHNADLFSDVLPKMVQEFSRDEATPKSDRVRGLSVLLNCVVDCLNSFVVAPPANAPELWQRRDRKLRETPYQFVRRVYAEYIGSGLTRSHIRKLDSSLYRALTNPYWLDKEGLTTPPQDLPTEREANDEAIERLFSGAATSNADVLPPAVREQLRLLEVVKTRKRRTPSSD